jgi:hypothetical protein
MNNDNQDGAIATFEQFRVLFLEKFRRSEAEQQRKVGELWDFKQKPGQTTEEYINLMRTKGAIANAREADIVNATKRGLLPDIAEFVSNHDNLDLDGIARWAAVAERNIAEKKQREFPGLREVIQDVFRSEFGKVKIAPLTPATTTTTSDDEERRGRSPARAVRFNEGARTPSRSSSPYREPFYAPQSQSHHDQSYRQPNGGRNFRDQLPYPRTSGPQHRESSPYPPSLRNRSGGPNTGPEGRHLVVGTSGSYNRGGNEPQWQFYNNQFGPPPQPTQPRQTRGDFNPGSQNFHNNSNLQFRNVCRRCGRSHLNRECAALNTQCMNCGRIGHWRAVCRSQARGQQN